MIIPTYFSAPVRGQDGDDVEYNVKWDNVMFACEIGKAIELDFPCLDVHIPHEFEAYIEETMNQGATSDDVLDICCAIIRQKKLLIEYIGHGFSDGMKQENAAALAAGLKIVRIAAYDQTAKDLIMAAIVELKEEMRQKGE